MEPNECEHNISNFRPDSECTITSTDHEQYSVASLEESIQPTQSIDTTDASIASPRGAKSSVQQTSQLTIPSLDEPAPSSNRAPGQTIPGTQASGSQKPEHRLRQESHPFYHAPLFTRTSVGPNISTTSSSYNQFWPYIVSPRRHTVCITAPVKGKEPSSKAYLYRNRYPTLLTLFLLIASFFPFAVIFTLLFGCYNAQKNPASAMPIQCTVEFLITPLLPLSFWIVCCWACIWAFRERVVIFWLSAKEDTYTHEFEWRFTLVKRGVILTSWGGFQGPMLEELYNDGMSRADIQLLRQPIAPLPPLPKNTGPQLLVQLPDHSNQSNPNTLIGIPYTPQLPKARNRAHPAYLPPKGFDDILLKDLDFQAKQGEDDLDPDAPGLTQEEKMRRWREKRRKQLYLGLTMTNSTVNPLVESSNNANRQQNSGDVALAPDGNKSNEGNQGDEIEGGINRNIWLSLFGKNNRKETTDGQLQESGSNNLRKGKGKAKWKGKGKEKEENTIPERQFDISRPIF